MKKAKALLLMSLVSAAAFAALVPGEAQAHTHKVCHWHHLHRTCHWVR
nr:HHHH-motif protein [Burkholderia diffusa]